MGGRNRLSASTLFFMGKLRTGLRTELNLYAEAPLYWAFLSSAPVTTQMCWDTLGISTWANFCNVDFRQPICKLRCITSCTVMFLFIAYLLESHQKVYNPDQFLWEAQIIITLSCFFLKPEIVFFFFFLKRDKNRK